MYQRAGKDGRDVQSLHMLEGVTASGMYRRNRWERLSLSLGSSPLIVQILPKKHSFFSRCTISRHPPDKSQVYFANNV